MTAERRSRLRGWYLHPSDPTCVRHWDGDRWERIRTRPPWSISAGDLVVDVVGRFETSAPWAGPVVEGPAPPGTERAAAGALGVGTEPKGGQSVRAGSRAHGAQAGHFPATGARGDFVSRPPGATSRRPLAIVTLMVVVGLVTLVTSAGWPRRTSTNQPPMPSAFVTRASTGCAAMLGFKRPSALPSDPVAVSAEVAQITTLTSHMRSLASATGATTQTNDWLASWGRFIGDEQKRAAALGPQPVPASPPPSASSSGASPDAIPGGVHAAISVPDPYA
ncbi:MAG: hypothetical protein M3137_21095, partial [Actinomycetota bacterium]|nr:hypothetical protein [Actinomycetota bacterium]